MEKLVDNLFKVAVVGFLVAIFWIMANIYLGSYDKRFCNYVSLDHAKEYGCMGGLE